MGLVTAKLRETAAHVIAMSVLVLNLRKIQHALLRMLAYLLEILAQNKNWALVQWTLIGYLNLLEEDPNMPPEQRAARVHIVLEKAYRLETMVNEFFEITKYKSQKITLSKETIDLYYMLVQLSDELSPVLAPRGNTVTLHLDENLTIEADPEKLARVFNNILKNAASYSFPHTEIVISAEKLEHEVIIRFQNSGEDIPNEALASLFNKFYRVDQSRSSDTGGTGLGLAIAKEIVTLHGGAISASSKNHVVTFTVSLPLSN